MMPKRRVNPASVCLGQQNKKLGFPTSHLRRSTALKWLTQPITGTNYWLSLSFDDTKPRFASKVKEPGIENKKLTIYYDMQCPYISQNVEMIKLYGEMHDIPVSLIQVDTLQKAKELPCVFNNFAVFYKGRFETVNLLTVDNLKRILKI